MPLQAVQILNGALSFGHVEPREHLLGPFIKLNGTFRKYFSLYMFTKIPSHSFKYESVMSRWGISSELSMCELERATSGSVVCKKCPFKVNISSSLSIKKINSETD